MLADPAETPDEIRRYIEEVVTGARVVGRLERLAVERHLRDLTEGEERGLHFDPEAGKHGLWFFTLLRHSKGKWARKPFKLSPWQAFIVWAVFGWKRADGNRRFREVYLEVAKKNGKSTFEAGLGLLLEISDNEEGAEVYSAATKRDQARIVFDEARNMVSASPDLSKHCEVLAHTIIVPRTRSKFLPLSADSKTLDGLNVHGGLIDELHAHPDRGVVDQLLTGSASRTQPLLIYITTAGWDRNSVCWEKREYGAKVLDGIFDDDSYFAFICALDEGDDWKDESVWCKANPNLGISVDIAGLREQAEKAKRSPAFENNFKRYRLNVWTQQADRVIAMEAWDACDDIDEKEAWVHDEARRELLEHRPCWGGLDLSSTQDITAFVLVFPVEGDDEAIDVLCRFWIPEDSVHLRVEQARVPYDVWVREGWIEATDGNVIDYRAVYARILEDAARFEIKQLGFDPHNAQKLVQELTEDGLPMVEFSQKVAKMAPPTKDLITKVLKGKVRHGNNPVLRWMASNCAGHVDAGGNVVFSKKKSTEKIDGMIALVMGLGLATAGDGVSEGPSIYETQGIERIG